MTNQWAPEYRLKLIKVLVVKSQNAPIGETYGSLIQRIAFLCDMPDSFLEANKSNYADAIKLADAGMTMFL